MINTCLIWDIWINKIYKDVNYQKSVINYYKEFIYYEKYLIREIKRKDIVIIEKQDIITRI